MAGTENNNAVWTAISSAVLAVLLSAMGWLGVSLHGIRQDLDDFRISSQDAMAGMEIRLRTEMQQIQTSASNTARETRGIQTQLDARFVDLTARVKTLNDNQADMRVSMDALQRK